MDGARHEHIGRRHLWGNLLDAILRCTLLMRESSTTPYSLEGERQGSPRSAGTSVSIIP